MSNIQGYLDKIKNARFGKDVRNAILNAIRQCYEDGKAGAIDLVAREEIEELKANGGGSGATAEQIQQIETNKEDIGKLQEEIADLPNEERVSEMIDEALGVIENGTY